MSSYRIVLANQTPLLRGMLHIVIEKDPDLEIVGETEHLGDIYKLVDNYHPHWVIISLPPNEEIPQFLDEMLIEETPLAILAISDDAARIKVKWIDQPEATFFGWSLDDLVSILHNKTTEKN